MRARVPLLSAALVVALAAAAPGSAAACSLAGPPSSDLELFNAADIAITGRVTRVRYLDREPPSGYRLTSRRYEATIRISRVYKGKTGPALRVTSTTSGAECGFGPLYVGQRLGFLLNGKRFPFAVSLGDRIRYAALERVTGGHSHRPGR